MAAAEVASALRRCGDWPSGRVAAAVVTGEGAEVVGDRSERFAWASLTKLLTAWAVLVAVEEGTLSLDEAAGPEGSTPRHLLSHASGLGADLPSGFGLRSGRGHASAVEALIPVAAPGVRRIYSNAGYELLATILSDRAGMDFRDYLGDGVLVPLGMSGVALEGSPAAGAAGGIDDLVGLAGELLAPRLISPASHAVATRVNFPGLAGVLPGFGRMIPNDWGLGPETRGLKNPHWTGRCNSPSTFGHFGRSGSFLWVDPEVPVACMALADREFGPWAKAAWPELSDAVLAALG